MEPLHDEQIRVLGCLAEKEATVPDSYPLTLNALRQACNQSSSRDPIVTYDDLTIQRALDTLKTLGLVRFVHPSHGERTTRFRHALDEKLGLDRGELALLTVLGLRGPQTVPELRTRTDRQHAFGDVTAVEATLRGLAEREEPLVVPLPRQPGQREGRWVQLLGGPVDVEAMASALATSSAPRAPSARSELEDELAALRTWVERIERELGLELPS